MTKRRIEDAVRYLRGQTDFVPRIAVVLGSGLGGYADTLSDAQAFDYAQIPGFPAPTTPGHVGRLVLGGKCGQNIAIMQGRFHCYEGYTPQETVIPLRALFLMGVRTLFATNASGGINLKFKAGDLAVITDHINFASLNPLAGPNLDELGARFPDMSYAYDGEYACLLARIAAEKGVALQRGVYAYMGGPSFETPAEIRALRILGADLVGMSTVPEIIAASHAGVRCCAVSCVTNMAAGIQQKKLTHEEVLQAGIQARDRLQTLIDAFLMEI